MLTSEVKLYYVSENIFVENYEVLFLYIRKARHCMSYNLLKSLHIKAGDTNFEYLLDFTKSGYRVSRARAHGKYFVYLQQHHLRGMKENLPHESSYVTDISYILNNSLKYSVKELFETLEGLRTLETFDNVILTGSTIDVFPVDNFSLELSKELYSTPYISHFGQYIRHECKRVTDFGVETKFMELLSVIDIALELVDGAVIAYKDNEKYYQILLTDRGKALITRYKMAKGL